MIRNNSLANHMRITWVAGISVYCYEHSVMLTLYQYPLGYILLLFTVTILMSISIVIHLCIMSQGTSTLYALHQCTIKSVSDSTSAVSNHNK